VIGTVSDAEMRTIDVIDPSLPFHDWKARMIDSGRRRHLCFGGDFDTRCVTLSTEIGETWDTEVKSLWTQNKENARAGLVWEFGECAKEAKIADFIAIDTKPFSVLAHHNQLYHQVRQSFVIGAYYPALVGACALGERILNHLMIDLRGFYVNTPQYKKIHSKRSFADWGLPIDTLEAWQVLLPEAVAEFRKLMDLRHRSVHFNTETTARLRDDALSAVLHMRAIIDQQFGSFGVRPWYIAGTRGQMFIRKDWEAHPFVLTYFVPQFSFVGHRFGIEGGEAGFQIRDFNNYGPGALTDEEFAAAYNDRDPSCIAGMKHGKGSLAG
jgi:hypothetical protein